MKKTKRELNVLSSVCKLIIINLIKVVEDFESLIKMSQTTTSKKTPKGPITSKAVNQLSSSLILHEFQQQVQMNAFPKLKDFEMYKNIVGSPTQISKEEKKSQVLGQHKKS